MSERRKKFFINGVILAIVGIFGRSVGLFFSSYISKTIGAEGMGLFGLISIVYSFATTFATSGISLTVTKLTSASIGEGNSRELSRIFRSSILYALIFSGAATLALFFLSPYFARVILKDMRVFLPLRVLAFSLIPLSVSSAVSGYFIGIRKVGRNAFISIFGQAVRIFLTVFLLSRFDKQSAETGVYIITLVMTLSEILVLIMSVLQYYLTKTPKSNGEKRHFSAVCNMALPLAISAYIRSALLTLEHSLIPEKLRQGGATHEEALSSYGSLHGMALPLLLFPMTPLSSFSGLLVPEFSESQSAGDQKRLDRIAGEALNTTLKYAVFVMCVLYLFSEEIGYVVYSSYEAGRYISFLAPVIPLMYLDHVTDSILKGIGEQVYSMWVNISDSVLSVILVIALIPKMGIMGYAVVILVMEGFNFILSITRLYKRIHFKIHLKEYLLYPLIEGSLICYITRRIFVSTSQNTRPLWLFCEILFAICLIIAGNVLLNLKNNKSRKM